MRIQTKSGQQNIFDHIKILDEKKKMLKTTQTKKKIWPIKTRLKKRNNLAIQLSHLDLATSKSLQELFISNLSKNCYAVPSPGFQNKSI